jgi:hypothetical protein
MASDNFIQLGKLNFDDIKSSIKQFLESQSELDYDFNGSIISNVVDLLAYNTMYYAFYSNMLINESFLDSAQRLDSLISLVKPFGYTISHRAAASARLKVAANTTTAVKLVPYESSFFATAPNGTQYTFYYTGGAENENQQTNEVFLPGAVQGQSTGTVVDIDVYQAKNVVIKQPVKVDYENQKIEIKNKTLDPRSLRIYVNEIDSGITQYKRVRNTDNTIDQNSEVYFLETSNDGYTVFFGGYKDTNGEISGRGVATGEDVFISYVNSNGSIANGSNQFSCNVSGSVVTNTLTQAINGYNSPDKKAIKFFAPREFSSAGRVVSRDDYVNRIAQLFTDIDTGNSEHNISVYGGPDTAERLNGISYVSLMRESDKAVLGSAENIVSDIKDKIVAGLSFAYRVPTPIDIQFSFDNIEARNAFNQLYFRNGSSKSFNVTVNASDIAKTSGTNGNFSKAFAEVKTFQGGQHEFDFKNALGGSGGGATLNASVTINGSNKKLTLNGIGELAGPSGTTYTNALDLNSGLVQFDKNKLGTFAFSGISADYNVNSGIIKIQHEVIGTLS